MQKRRVTDPEEIKRIMQELAERENGTRKRTSITDFKRRTAPVQKPVPTLNTPAEKQELLKKKIPHMKLKRGPKPA